MKSLKLNRGKLDAIVDGYDIDLKALQPTTRALRVDLIDSIELLLTTLVTPNYLVKQRGIISYIPSGRGRNKRNHNPFLLCNGDFIYDVEYGDMPILLHTEVYRNLSPSIPLKRLIDDLGILRKCKFSPGQKKLCKSNEIKSKHYFILTPLGKSLLPEEIEFFELNKAQTKKITKYFHAKNGTIRNEYKRLIRMLPEFQFHLPKWEVFRDRHIIEFQSLSDYVDIVPDKDSECERLRRTPDQLLRIVYNQMQNYNNTDLSGFVMKCSSDINTWGGRFYGLPSFIHHIARYYLRSRETGSYLVELDIRNSQFHMLNAVLREKLGKESTGQFDLDLRNDVDIYIKVAQQIFRETAPSDEQRTTVKTGMFYSFFRGSFEPTKMTEEDKAKVMEAVKELYPELIKSVEGLQRLRIAGFKRTLPYWFSKLKHGTADYRKKHEDQNYRKVSFCATSTETKIMKRIWNATYKDKIDYLTVHDALLVDPKDAGVAKDHLEQILEEELGYLPFVKETQLSPGKAIEESNMKKSIMMGRQIKHHAELLTNNHVELLIKQTKEAA